MVAGIPFLPWLGVSVLALREGGAVFPSDHGPRPVPGSYFDGEVFPPASLGPWPRSICAHGIYPSVSGSAAL